MIPVAVAIIAITGNQVLLVRNAKRGGSVEIPGGARLSGEGPFTAARREFREETGLIIGPLWEDLMPVYTKYAHGWNVDVLHALRWSGELRAGSDASDCFFGDPELLLTGQRPEDYKTVARAMYCRKVAGGR